VASLSKRAASSGEKIVLETVAIISQEHATAKSRTNNNKIFNAEDAMFNAKFAE
jgi:hypothetical protein